MSVLATMTKDKPISAASKLALITKRFRTGRPSSNTRFKIYMLPPTRGTRASHLEGRYLLGS